MLGIMGKIKTLPKKRGFINEGGISRGNKNYYYK
jgi:hypothetical protein